jgi:hypothetical protein
MVAGRTAASSKSRTKRPLEVQHGRNLLDAHCLCTATANQQSTTVHVTLRVQKLARPRAEVCHAVRNTGTADAAAVMQTLQLIRSQWSLKICRLSSSTTVTVFLP